MERPLRIFAIDADDSRHQRAVLEYLAPHEPHGLFIIGNLINRFPESHLYAAERAGEWVGIGGYYAIPRSLIPFSTAPEVVRALVRHIAERHRPIEYLNGIGYAAWPALEELTLLGHKVVHDPRQVFMEMPLPPHGLPLWPGEDRVRASCEEDAPQVSMLLRQITRPHDLSPPSPEELGKAQRPLTERLVLVEADRIVATASTNGLGLRSFQILGVATDPAFRRKGLARAVCAALIRRLQARGAQHAALFTRVDNEAAIACYQGMGFAVTEDFCVAQFDITG